MHNKILVIDDTVITGSYNFSRSAQFNAENILFIESAALAERYSDYIDHFWRNMAGLTVASAPNESEGDMTCAVAIFELASNLFRAILG